MKGLVDSSINPHLKHADSTDHCSPTSSSRTPVGSDTLQRMVAEIWIHVFALASLAEMVDHTNTNWVYVNHNSFFNGVFYGALSAGLALLTASVSHSRSWRLSLLLITIATLAAYPIGGKSFAISLQSLLLVLMLCQWWRCFADPRLWLYVLFGVVLTTGMGILLVESGDPVWHLFIGPCGSLSVISLGWVLKRSLRLN